MTEQIKKTSLKNIGIVLGIFGLIFTGFWILWMVGTKGNLIPVEKRWRGEDFRYIENHLHQDISDKGFDKIFFAVEEKGKRRNSEIIFYCRVNMYDLTEEDWDKIKTYVSESVGIILSEVKWQVSKLIFSQAGIEKYWIAGVECENAIQIKDLQDRNKFILSNIRESKKSAVVKTKKDDTKFGISERKRRKIFYDLVELQDNFLKKDPYNTQKQQDAYRIIAERHGIAESDVRKIALEGAKKRWPMPDY